MAKREIPEDYVRMATQLCKVTGKKFESGEILISMHLKSIPKDKTLTGWGISPEVQEKMDEGYVPLVCVDHNKSDKLPNGNITPEGAYRTGEIAYVRRHVLEKLGDVPADQDFMFIDRGLLGILSSLQVKESN